MALTRTELETYTALRRHPWCTVHDLRVALALSPGHTTRNRLQALRRKGLARTNGRRGRDCKWHAIEPSDTPLEFGGSLPFDVHRELAAANLAMRPHEVAAILDADIGEVEAAMRYLVARGIIAQHEDRFLVRPRQALKREDYEREIRNEVTTWHSERSPAVIEASSTHDLEVLISRLCQLLA